MAKLALVLFWFLIALPDLAAQNVPLNGWASHVSYQSGSCLALTQNEAFCSTYNGLFKVAISDKSKVSLSKINGLHVVGVSAMTYDSSLNLLLVAYRNGNLDQIDLERDLPAAVVNWPLLLESDLLPEQRAVRLIRSRNGLAYLATDFGVIVLDIGRQEVREMYRYIGAGAKEVAVSGMTFSSDSIFLATSDGILAASLGSTINRQYDGNWRSVPTRFRAYSICYFNNKLYAAFPGYGVARRDKGSWVTVYPSVSSAVELDVTGGKIIATLDDHVITLDNREQVTVFRESGFPKPSRALTDASGKLWVADGVNGLVTNATASGRFEIVSPATGDTTIVMRSDSSVTDQNGVNWVRLPEYLGGGIRITDGTGRQRYLTTAAGNGGLPSMRINSLSVDTEGYIWFASDRGAGYFWPDGVLSGGALTAVLPVFGQRKLLSSERCSALAIEPGNRKWIAATSGLYLFNDEGTELIRQFNAENSPLPSNTITALHFENKTGVLFVDTPSGMVSYHSDATLPAETLSQLTIFPNPVRPGYSGWVGIRGLVDQSVVKITDLNGRLVYETRSQGGIASWNLLDYTGRRARGGVYLVLVVTPDGTETLAGKLAVIE